MSFHYLDASAWVKRYLHEPGSAWVHALFANKQNLACVSLGFVEVCAALARQFALRPTQPPSLPELQRAVVADWADILEAQIDATLLTSASALAWELKLRGADAIHLAAAIRLQQSLSDPTERVIFVSADHELLEAAERKGLQPVNPAQMPEGAATSG